MLILASQRIEDLFPKEWNFGQPGSSTKVEKISWNISNILDVETKERHNIFLTFSQFQEKKLLPNIFKFIRRRVSPNMKLYKIQFISCSAWCWAKSSGVVYTGLGCRWLIYICICVCFLFVFVFVFVFVFACYPGPQVTYIHVKEMPLLRSHMV